MNAEVVDLLAYPPPPAWDEMTGAGEGVRPHWRHLLDSLSRLGGVELERRQGELARLLHDDGVVSVAPGATSRRWVLDPVPLLVDSDEWRRIEQGLTQRAELLELVISDLYGGRDLVRKGLLPPELVLGDPGFLRPCDGVVPRSGHHLLLHAADVARDGSGQPWVLADRSQAPSGMGYALENRIVMTRVFPSIFRDSHVHRLAPFFRAFRSTLARVAPEGREAQPLTVILTPGPWTDTYFEHAFLASYLGYPLVQGPDLEVRGGAVWLRSLGERERVDVVVRRVDDDWCDPLELRPESELGIPGLVEMVRRGAVSVANPLGSGVVEHPALPAFLPALARHLLGQDLQVPSVPTWWCGDDRDRAMVLGALDRFVLRKVRTAPERGIVGAELSAAQREELVRRIEAQPHQWAAQEMVPVATAPSFEAGTLVARPAVLRTFAVAHEGSYLLLPGGLARVATEASLPLVSSAGAASKDTWVLASEPESQAGFLTVSSSAAAALDPAHAISSRVAENLFWMGRYAERAEDTVRLTRVILDRRNDTAGRWNPSATESLGVLLRTLTQVTGTWPGFCGDDGEAQRARPEARLRETLLDAERGGTLAFDVAALLTAANTVRDQLSLDTWMVLNTLDDDLAALRGRPETVGFPPTARVALSGMMKSLLALQGLVNESMVRDSGWWFLDAGRRVERALLLVGLLRSTVVEVREPAVDVLVYESLLLTAESVVTFRRRSRSRLDAVAMLELLLADPSNPRSLAYQLARLGESVAEMPRSSSLRRSPEERLVLEASTRLALADVGELEVADGGRRPALAALLDELTELLVAAAAAVGESHFPPLPSRQFVGGMVVGG